jgi:hypothetical protein
VLDESKCAVAHACVCCWRALLRRMRGVCTTLCGLHASAPAAFRRSGAAPDWRCQRTPVCACGSCACACLVCSALQCVGLPVQHCFRPLVYEKWRRAAAEASERHQRGARRTGEAALPVCVAHPVLCAPHVLRHARGAGCGGWACVRACVRTSHRITCWEAQTAHSRGVVRARAGGGGGQKMPSADNAARTYVQHACCTRTNKQTASGAAAATRRRHTPPQPSGPLKEHRARSLAAAGCCCPAAAAAARWCACRRRRCRRRCCCCRLCAARCH